jgi:hypothetical protein
VALARTDDPAAPRHALPSPAAPPSSAFRHRSDSPGGQSQIAQLQIREPPVGLNLFLSSYRFNKPLPEVMRSVVPIVLAPGLGVLPITYVPALTTMAPRWLGRSAESRKSWPEGARQEN